MTPLEAGRLAHPYFADAGPCTLLIDEVEALWAPIAEGDDWSALHAKLAAIDRMAEAYGTRVAPPGSVFEASSTHLGASSTPLGASSD
jgi:hypothetical protein